MTVPSHRAADGSEVEAVQFIKADPTTHWHVNFGHPVAKALDGCHWVLTASGPIEVADGNYVVRRNGGAPEIVPAADFEAAYQPVSAEA